MFFTKHMAAIKRLGVGNPYNSLSFSPALSRVSSSLAKQKRNML